MQQEDKEKYEEPVLMELAWDRSIVQGGGTVTKEDSLVGIDEEETDI